MTKHRSALDRVAHALLEKETLDRDELDVLLAGVEAESSASQTVGTVRVPAVRPLHNGEGPDIVKGSDPG